MRPKRDFPGMFDAAKGILMLLVILAHQKGFFRAALGIDSPLLAAKSFGEHYDVVIMGLFFLMAGYTTHVEKDLRGYVKRSAKAFLIPYFLTMAALVGLMSVRYLLAGAFSCSVISPILLGFLYGNGIAGAQVLGGWTAESVGAAWFLPALFWSGLFHQLLLRIDRPAVRQAAVWGLTAAAAAVPSAYELSIPWFLVPGCTAVGFREIGRLLKSRKLLYRRPSWPLAGAAVLLSLVLHHVSAAKFWSNLWQLWMLDYLSAAAVGAVLMQVYLWSGLAVADFTDGLAYIGRYSLFFFCLHNIEMLLFPWYKLYVRVAVPFQVPWGAAFLLAYVVRVAFAAAGCHAILWARGRLNRIGRMGT